MSALSAAERRALRSRAHHLPAVLSIGEAGVTAPVLAELDRCLRSHELIKVRALVGDRHERKAMNDSICRELGAHAVQHIGRILVLFRPRPAEAARPPAQTRLPRKPHHGSPPRRGRRQSRQRR